METLTSTDSSPKILYVITKSNFGGAQKYVYELAVEMKRQGYVVAVACGGRGELVDRLKSADITTYEVKGLERDISILKEIKAIVSLTKIIYQIKPGIIHLNSAKAGLLGSIIARLLRVPKIIFTAHGWPFLEPRSRTWQNLAWLGSYFTSLLSHHIINVSQFDFQHGKMPGVQSKSSVIHTAISEFPLLSREEARNLLIGEEKNRTTPI